MSNRNEEDIRADYCAGILSIQKVADKHGLKKSTLIDLAERRGWVRNKAPAKVVKKKPTNPTKKSDQNANGRVDGRKANRSEMVDAQEQTAEVKSSLPANTELDFDPDEYGLTLKEADFVFHYLKTDSRVEAYRLAGYEGQGNTAYVGASRLYRKDKVSKAIRALKNRVRERYSAELDEIVDQLVAITRADPNEVAQYRRVNCRYCWGDEHCYQWRDESEYDRAERKATADSKPPPEYGGLGFVSNADPNPDCPRCNGEGEGEIKIADTRDLDGDGQHYYLGVKQTKTGIEVLTESKQAARAMLIKIIENRKENDDDSVMNVMPVPTTDNVDDWEKFAQAQQDKSLGK
ncbi:terminase small subunit [Rahnella sp. ChDrAdgB13]|uniref:terminase small subunit n=1 Tax=Rahnella sp. ChDrAdgB13 TaxID=1850581 RepID=UPI001AD8575F|nr:terminase small subunit [Rahnella sp. ChDrAdgB13]